MEKSPESTIPRELQPFIKTWPRDTWMQQRLAKLLRDQALELEKHYELRKVQS